MTYAAGCLINGAKIENHTIAASKLTAVAVQSLHGQHGAQGVSGQRGSSGAIDLSRITYVDSGAVSIASGTTGGAHAVCPSGAKVVGGGWIIVHGNDERVDATGAGPNPTLTHWSAVIVNSSAASASAEAYAVCVSA